jgi:hypothetical protein
MKTTLHGSVAALVATLLISSAPATAQVVHMNTATKKQYFLGILQGAETAHKGGRAGVAKLACFGAGKLFFSMSRIPYFLRRNPNLLKRFAAVCDPIYKGHKGDASAGAATQAKYGPRLSEYGRALRLPPIWKRRPGKTYKEIKRVVEARQLGAKAVPYAIEYVNKMPELSLCFKGRCKGYEKTWDDVIAILFAKHAAATLIKSHAIPTIEAALSRAEGAVDNKSEASLLRATNELERWVALLRQAKPDHPGVAKYQGIAKAFAKRADRLSAARIAAARMPKALYRGGGAAAVKAAAKASYRRRYPKEKVLEVVLRQAKWSPATGEGWWQGKVWKWGVFSRLRVAVAVRQRIKGKTSYRVFHFTMARQRRSGGGWSTPYMLGGTDHGYPILKKNI